ncbi:hypothetical protein PHLCEN_2v1960 [Hermanssonia centrifuga]|uniref:Uncharacterized protein n=1 Tax=Hermanssonia centrifuga TaxID=98765 RepID=A0A2R6RVD8_9APHY|nr:hypothetical protein PHLCEN_2v1960 [Hermanssonia centrifuga]
MELTATDNTVVVLREDVKDTIRYHYGYLAPKSGNVYLSQLATEVQLRHHQVNRLLGGLDFAADQSPQEVCAMVDFVTTLARGQLPPVALCDLVPGNPASPWKATRMITRVTSLPGQWYAITTGLDQKDTSWVLAVQSATTACEVLRRAWGPSKIDIASECLKRGIPIRTLMRVDERQEHGPMFEANIRPRAPAFGYQLPWYNPTPVDYRAYEYWRDMLLQRSCGRVGLMKGGIIWRLTLEAVGVETVLVGPSGDLSAQYEVSIGDKTHFDDDLTTDEADIIVGVYKVLTPHSIRNTSDASWWPKSQVWDQSGCCVGYWTPANEDWFLKRLKAIREGRATLMNSNHWRKHLKIERREAMNLRGTIEELSVEALRNLPGRAPPSPT